VIELASGIGSTEKDDPVEADFEAGGLIPLVM